MGDSFVRDGTRRFLPLPVIRARTAALRDASHASHRFLCFFRPLEHSQSVQNGKSSCGIPADTTLVPGADDLSRRQKRLHNSDINLNANNAFALDTHRFKRQKSSKYRRFAESSSLLSLPSLFSPAALTNDSSATLTPSTNQLFLPTKRSFTDEAAVDADDEKDARDESVHVNRHHRYHHQLSHTRLKQQDVTSEDDDEELLLRNHRGMIDFMDRVSRRPRGLHPIMVSSSKSSTPSTRRSR